MRHLTKPDIAFTANQVCQFLHQSRISHLQAIKRIFRYMKRTIYHGLVFNLSSNFNLVAYVNSDWSYDPDDHRSTTGACIFLGPNLLTLTTKKQFSMSPSNTEALALTAAK